MPECDVLGERSGVGGGDDLAEVEHDPLVRDAQRAARVLLDVITSLH